MRIEFHADNGELLTPIEVANGLIMHTTHCEKYMMVPERDINTFSVDELREIAEYLQVYCRYHRDVEDITF